MTVSEESNEQYHSDTKYLSRSMLMEFVERPSIFHGRYIGNTIPRKEATESMVRGTIIHSLVLEPQNDIITFIPREIQSSDGKNTTKAAKEFVEQVRAEGKFPVSVKEYGERIKPAVEAVKTCLNAMNVRRNDVYEQSLRWENTASGIRCRCKPDIVCRRENLTAIVDLKTTDEVTDEGFTYSVRDFGYWLQQSHYEEGVRDAFRIETPIEFVFVVVETNPPYACRQFQLEEDDAAVSAVARQNVLLDLARRLESGDWSDPGADQIKRIRVPRYVFKGFDKGETT